MNFEMRRQRSATRVSNLLSDPYPRGKVASYGQVAEAAGYPRGHRLVARFLRDISGIGLPWQRVIGAGGEVKTTGRSAAKQRALLKEEGVQSENARINLEQYGHIFED